MRLFPALLMSVFFLTGCPSKGDDTGCPSPEDEICDGRDNDCDGEIDEDGAVGAPAWYPDSDGDGYGADPEASANIDSDITYSSIAIVSCDQPDGYTMTHSDCDDQSWTISPEATELCNGYDDDCDGDIDEDDAADGPCDDN